MVHNKHSFCSYFDLTAASNYSYGTPIRLYQQRLCFTYVEPTKCLFHILQLRLRSIPIWGELNDNTLAILQCGAKW